MDLLFLKVDAIIESLALIKTQIYSLGTQSPLVIAQE